MPSIRRPKIGVGIGSLTKFGCFLPRPDSEPLRSTWRWMCHIWSHSWLMWTSSLTLYPPVPSFVPWLGGADRETKLKLLTEYKIYVVRQRKSCGTWMRSARMVESPCTTTTRAFLFALDDICKQTIHASWLSFLKFSLVTATWLVGNLPTRVHLRLVEQIFFYPVRHALCFFPSSWTNLVVWISEVLMWWRTHSASILQMRKNAGDFFYSGVCMLLGSLVKVHKSLHPIMNQFTTASAEETT